MSFNTSYYHAGQLVTNRAYIALNHVKTWFVVDLLTIVPDWYGYFAEMTVKASEMEDNEEGDNDALGLLRMSKAARTLRLLRLLRILRVLKVRKFASTLNDIMVDFSDLSKLVVQIFQLILTVLVFMHFICCGWYALSTALHIEYDTWVEHYLLSDIEENQHLQYRYMTSMHWALTQMTTGTMEVNARNWIERIYSCSTLIFSLVMFSSFVSTMTVTFTQIRSHFTDQTKRFNVLRRYMAANQIPHQLAVRINHFLVARIEALSRVTQEEQVELLPLLSTGMLSELRRATLCPKLSRYYFFAKLTMAHDDVSLAITSRVCKELKNCNVGPDERIFTSGERGIGIYVLIRGTFNFHANKNLLEGLPGEQDIDVLLVGPEQPPDGYEVHWLSEFALLINWVHKASLVSAWYSDYIVVSRESFTSCLAAFPDSP